MFPLVTLAFEGPLHSGSVAKLKSSLHFIIVHIRIVTHNGGSPQTIYAGLRVVLRTELLAQLGEKDSLLQT